jgi:magnesium-transporting ATPase (P-type)
MKKLWQVVKVILVLFGFVLLWGLVLDSYVPPDTNSIFESISSTIENFESENDTSMFYINFIYVLSIISFFIWRKNKNAEKNTISDEEIFGLRQGAVWFLNSFLSLLAVFAINAQGPPVLGVWGSIGFIILFWIILMLLSIATGDWNTKK